MAVSLMMGICIGLPYSIEDVVISWKIELFDLISLIVTILLAIYVAISLERRVQDDRVEKELHIEQINQIEQIINELESILRSDDIQYQDIISRISKIRIKKNNIVNAIKDCLPELSAIIKDRTDSITRSIDSLKRLLTETSVDNNTDVVMVNGILTYSSNRISDISNSIYALENELYRLKIIINRT